MVSESGYSSAEIEPLSTVRRFESYQLLLGEDGKPIELGRGAMGITYKAFDVDLRCPVTLKVISERYVGDDSARLRFLREARAAAKLRHSNVASVLRLGRTGADYFYAMEFVEGETLESLIKRRGRVKPDLALEITTQVAAGLAAIHRQKLVHRDIKPSNIMVTLDEVEPVTAKIIDLGLAKAVDEPHSGTAISVLGAFAGTPGYASPEQFAGLAVDIRSDLYSLGVTLWQMLTGQVPFKGTPAELMHKHQHVPLPLEGLKDLPQPVTALLEVLLAKDPQRRFQNPAELLKMMPVIAGAIDAGRTVDPQSLRTLPEERAILREKVTENPSAYDLYSRAMALVQLQDRDANQKAIEFLRKAIKQDPNFALGHAGLALAYIEQEGLGGEKSLLDSAVELCRIAIALDPREVRGYQQLARAYFMKGWFSQCDEALQKALELGPDDSRTNALAAHRALAGHRFGESYKFFQKAHSLNPNQTNWLYLSAEVLFRVGLSDVAEKWMRQALEKESNPQSHHMMECYRMMWRRKFAAAQAGFAQLPLELKRYDYSPSDGLLFCAVGLGDWPALIQSCKTCLEESPEKVWPRTYLAIALQRLGREAEAREMAEQVLERGLEWLERPAQPAVPWDAPLYIAWAYRFLERKDEAYRYLDEYLAHRTLLHIALGLDNPILDAFKADPEFNTILTDMNQKFEVARRSIREHEAGSS
jgi:serine/threonine protein kinase/Flp pilus assembly protein TadD